MQLGRSCWLDLLAQILRRSLITDLVPAEGPRHSAVSRPVFRTIEGVRQTPWFSGAIDAWRPWGMASIPPHGLRRRRRSRSEFSDLVRKFQQPGLWIADFARKVGVHPVIVQGWVGVVSKGPANGVSFARIASVPHCLAPEPPTNGSSAGYVSPTGWRIFFPMAIGPRHPSPLIDIFRRRCASSPASFATSSSSTPSRFISLSSPPYGASTPKHGCVGWAGAKAKEPPASVGGGGSGQS